MVTDMGATPACKRCSGMVRQARSLAPQHSAECRERFRTLLSRSERGRRILESADARLRPQEGPEGHAGAETAEERDPGMEVDEGEA